MSIEDANRRALLGHVALWDPLFFLWGFFLLVGMLKSRRPRVDRPNGLS